MDRQHTEYNQVHELIFKGIVLQAKIFHLLSALVRSRAEPSL